MFRNRQLSSKHNSIQYTTIMVTVIIIPKRTLLPFFICICIYTYKLHNVCYIYNVYVPRYIPCPHVSTFQYLYPIRPQSHFAPAPREFPGSIVEATVLCVCKRLATRKSGQAERKVPQVPLSCQARLKNRLWILI
jgi:hypothetical protein